MADRGVRACLITNPRSGRGGVDLSTVLPVLQAHGWHAVVRAKQHGGHATELARDAARDGFDVVVNCAGDGTLNEIANGLAGTDVAVGTIPGGTANLWAHEVGISQRLDVAALQLVGAERRRVDLGRVTINGRHGRYFVLMAGLGFDGAVMGRVSKPLKNRIGPAAVGLAAVQALPSFHPVAVRADVDGLHWQGRVSQVIVGNTRRYGGFTRITADAYVDDGLLDVCLITATGPVAVGRQVAALLLRQRPSAQTAESYRVPRVTIYAPVTLPLQLDGGSVRVKEKPGPAGISYAFSLLAHGLTVLVPPTYDGDLFQEGSMARSPLRLPPAQADPGTRKGKKGRAHKRARRTLQVVSVEVAAITAARMDDGRVLKVLIGPDTVAKGAGGAKQPIALFLSDLMAGDVIHVKGKKDPAHDAIRARRITLLSSRDAAR